MRAGPGDAGETRAESPRRLRDATRRLLEFFRPRSGRWITPTGEAWQPAIAIGAVLAAYDIGRDDSLLDVVSASFRRYRGRRSRFVDDDGWYLGAWLQAYELSAVPAYLDESRSLFDELTRAWDDTCGGGLWWRKDRTYKNAITNELFLLAAGRLHELCGEPHYLDWARRSWAWFEASGIINAHGLVNDGLDPTCTNNGQQTWTYNQGVILSALVQLSRCTNNPTPLATATRIADAAIASLVDSTGTLSDLGETDTANLDSHAFKGVFALGLARLATAPVAATHAAAYRSFLRANADRLWSAGRDERDGIGLCWAGPVGSVNAATQASGTLLLAAVAGLDPPRP